MIYLDVLCDFQKSNCVERETDKTINFLSEMLKNRLSYWIRNVLKQILTGLNHDIITSIFYRIDFIEKLILNFRIWLLLLSDNESWVSDIGVLQLSFIQMFIRSQKQVNNLRAYIYILNQSPISTNHKLRSINSVLFTFAN